MALSGAFFPKESIRVHPLLDNITSNRRQTLKLSQRTILITGGTSGIGLEMARQLHSRGNTIIVTGRSSERLAETEAAVPGVHAIQSDATDPAAIEALRDRLAIKFPALDVIFNNAGIMRNLKLYADRSLSDVAREIDSNLRGPVQLVQAFLPGLLARNTALIVNVSSGLAFIPLPISPVYSATKAAIHAYTECLRIQLKNSNVKIVELAPPGTETPLFHGEFEEEMKGQKAMPVDVLVRKAIAGIEAGKTNIRPGLSNVLYAMSRLAPSFMLGQLSKTGA